MHFIQAILHFRTLKLQQDGSLEEGDVLDDTRKMVTGPFELLMGREFKLGVWEEMVKTMRIGEVARFRCPFKVCIMVLYLIPRIECVSITVTKYQLVLICSLLPGSHCSTWEMRLTKRNLTAL